MDKFYIYQSMSCVYEMGYYFVEETFKVKELQKLLSSKEKFDLVIMEQFINEAQLYIPHYFKAPLILVSSVGSGTWTNHYVSNPSALSHVPHYFLPFSGKMSFWERVNNVFWTFYDQIYSNLIVYPKHEEILHKFYPEAPPLKDLMKNVSLVLLNSHVSFKEPSPHVPNMIEIGGYHVKPTGKIPEDVKKFLDEAKDGVIFLCMGSNLKISKFPENKRKAFVKAFSKRKERVLWKYETDLPEKPENVMLVKWAPQQDILG